MLVEYEAQKLVTRVGDAVLDVPVEKILPDGSIDVDWARENVGELMISDEDFVSEQMGEPETAIGTPMDEDGDPIDENGEPVE